MVADMKKTVMDAAGVAGVLARMADEIVGGGDDPVLVGIRTGGALLAGRIQELIRRRTGRTVPLGVIDIGLYRDDWTRKFPKPEVGKTELNFSIDDKRVVLVDDVLYTGRTVRAAMDALMDFGRPARVELAVLADRGRRELPICTNYTGLTLEIGPDERVNVYFSDFGQEDEIAVESGR